MISTRCIKKLPSWFPKYYQIIIAIICILEKVNSIDDKIGSYRDLESLGNITNHYDYLDYAARRYKRQSKGACKIPNNSSHTVYAVLSDSETNYKPGDYVNNFSLLETKCEKGYNQSPFVPAFSNCINGQWIPPLTTCIRTCPSLMSSSTTTVKCKYNGISLDDCINPVTSTTVRLSCNDFYEESSIQKNPLRVCRGGVWYPAIPECYPTCGLKSPKGNVNIVMGQNATPGDYPWQVGIYSNLKEFLCGGSIIDQHIILSAAHCFTDYYGNVKPTENYLIAAGKYYREYDDYRDHIAQYSSILEIHVPERYKGLTGFHAFDIAILILKDPFELSIGVQPVCIELNEESPFLHFSLNTQGVVMGWGYTQEGDQLSDVLKELTIPYVPFDKCYKEIVENFRKFVTFDKICAGYINNATSVCGGDSGGGLSFKNMFDDRYYVKAIVSASPATDVLQCDTNQYSVYTSIDKHIDFVRDLIAFNRRQKPLVCKQADCRNEKTENDDHCLLPNHPAHGTYSLASQSETYKPAKNVPKFTAILLTCHTGYEANPSGAGQFLCLDKRQWTPVPGTCTELQLPIKFNIHEVGGKSKQKCQEYGKHVFENGNIETLPGRSSLLGTNKNCPFTESKNTDSVQRAKQYEFPHMALIGFDVNNETVWLCAGSLISEKFVLTAAHCIRHLYFGLAKYVLLGDLIIHSLEDGTLTNQQISIKTRISHPSYSPPIKYHNIALLELEHNAILNAYVRPACLNTNPNLINEISIVSGWDQNEIFAGVKPYMQKATVTVFPNAECNDVYKENIDENLINGIDEKTLVCAGARYKSEVDVCQGGDPLQIVNSEVSCTYKIIGVTSFKKSCGVVNIPGVYTNVFGYLKWIENIVWP